VMVTPTIARELLKHNSPGDSNRVISRAFVDEMAGQLRDGKWINTGEPVIMSDQGLLNDGQHRLQAIVETGIGCLMDLRFGIRREAFAKTDAGRKRSGGDALTIAGASSDPFNTAAAARLILSYVKGLPNAAYERTNNGDIVAAVERWPDLPAAVSQTQSLRKPLRNAATSALSWMALRTANEASVNEFFDVLRLGEGRATNPPHALREFMMITHASPGHDTKTRMRVFAACILAWNAWRNPKEKAKLNLYWRDNQAFPVCEGLEL